jgi:hypothetical protein
LNYRRIMHIRHRCYKCTIFVRKQKKKKNRITKRHSTQSKNQSDTGVRRENDEI